MRTSRKILSFVAALCWTAGLVSATAWGASSGKTNLILLDASGSMEESDRSITRYSNGSVQAILVRLLSTPGVLGADDSVRVGRFSRYKDQPTTMDWLDERELAQVRSGAEQLQALGGGTDLPGAVQMAEAEAERHGGARIIWLLTDNRNQPSAPEDEDTLGFYKYLARAKSLTRITVFSIDDGEAEALALYVMLYEPAGPSAARAQIYDQTIAAVSASTLSPQLGDGPFRVRPITQDALSLQIVDFQPKGEGIEAVRSDVAGEYIRLYGYREGAPIEGNLTVRIRSHFPVLKIVDAKIEAVLTDIDTGIFTGDKQFVQEIAPTRVTLEPDEEAIYTIHLKLDPPNMLWEPLKQPLAVMDSEGAIGATLRLNVHNITLEPVPSNKIHMVNLMKGSLISTDDVKIELTRPVAIQILLSLERFFWAYGALVALVALTVGGILWWRAARRGRPQWLMVGRGLERQEVRVAPHQSRTLPGWGRFEQGAYSRVTFFPEGSDAGQKLSKSGGLLRLVGGQQLPYTFERRHGFLTAKTGKTEGVRGHVRHSRPRG